MVVPAVHRAVVAGADGRFQEAYGVVAAAVQDVFADAEAASAHDMAAWRVPRPPDKVEPIRGTFDPAVIFIGLADRKAGPTLHVWHPGAYDLLDRNAAWLKAAGFKVMKGCLPWTRKGAYPAQAVGRLLEQARAVDD